jgi:hypothetical protein
VGHRDAAGALYIADFDNNAIRRVANGVITTVAGTGAQGYNGDDIPATAALLNNPIDVAIDPTGNLYIADHHNHRIRRVDAATQVITTVAGTGVAGYGGDGGPAVFAEMNEPGDVKVDETGAVWFTDFENHRVRRFTVGGSIETVAGNGLRGYAGGRAARPRTRGCSSRWGSSPSARSGRVHRASELRCAARVDGAGLQQGARRLPRRGRGLVRAGAGATARGTASASSKVRAALGGRCAASRVTGVDGGSDLRRRYGLGHVHVPLARCASTRTSASVRARPRHACRPPEGRAPASPPLAARRSPARSAASLARRRSRGGAASLARGRRAQPLHPVRVVRRSPSKARGQEQDHRRRRDDNGQGRTRASSPARVWRRDSRNLNH